MKRYLAWLALLMILACQSPERVSDHAFVTDLASQLDGAEVLLETGLIDIGTPDARPFLGPGWSWNEKDKSGATFVWASRFSSEVQFFVTEPRALRMQFRCKPLRQEARSIEGLSISANNELLGKVMLRRGWQDYDFSLPAESLHRGINRLVFEYHWQVGPVESSKRAGRQVGVAWDWIRFPQIVTSERPSMSQADALSFVSGSQVDFHLAAPGETMLVIDEVRQMDSVEGYLEISAQMDGEDEPTVRRTEGRELEEDLRFQLTQEAGLTRLRFLAHGDFELTRPRVISAAASGQALIETPAAAPPSIPRVRPSLVVLYLIDTLRADHLSTYGYEKDTSPGLARLMTDAVVFEDVVAQSSWTKPSTASILTGHLPWSHGAERREDGLSGRIRSLAHYLGEASYRTGAFSANGYIAQAFGFHHGFDHFSLMRQHDASAVEVQEQALQWLASLDSSAAAFLYAHTIDPHAPYDPPERSGSGVANGTTRSRVGTVPFMRQLAKTRKEPEPDLVRELIDLYDGEITFNDQQLAELIESLKSLGLYEESLILVVSDHGEEFYDHGNWTHGRTLHREVLQVPLLIKFPGNWGAGARIADTAQQIDLLPTVLDYLEIPRPLELPGESLLCSIQQSMADTDLNCATSRPRTLFSSVHYHHNHWVGVTLGDWKLILRGAERLDREAKLFHRRLDPEERENVADLYPVRVGYLVSLIRTEMRNRPVEGASETVELDEETRERLEALGYLN